MKEKLNEKIEKAASAEGKKVNHNMNYLALAVFLLVVVATYIKGPFPVDSEGNAIYGAWSLIPPVMAVIFAFITREALFALLLASISALFIMGEGLWGLPGLFEDALGNGWFIWVVMIEVFIGILVSFFLKTGSTGEFSNVVGKKIKTRVGVQLLAWILGMFIFFSDYFSPLFVGPVMKDLTDKAKVSREKLAYICDSTSAPMSVLVPFSSWGVYITGLLVGLGTIENLNQASSVFFGSVLFNFYAIFAIAMVGLIAKGIIPEFGPMKKAEERAINEGKVLADGAQPLMGVELSSIEKAEEIEKPNLILNFFTPVVIVIVIAVGSYIISGSAKTLEAFMFAVFFLGVVMIFQKLSIKDIFDTAVQGIKGVTPAIAILAMAYLINTASSNLGTASYVIEITESWLTPSLLPLLAFLLSGFIAFSTGTSWGTYAIMIPIAVPLAFAFSGGAVTTVVSASIGAVAGGGVFGDHCSPLSDTTILSSFGAASDHIDHVKTQLPYASVAAGLGLIVYLIIGII